MPRLIALSVDRKKKPEGEKNMATGSLEDAAPYGSFWSSGDNPNSPPVTKSAGIRLFHSGGRAVASRHYEAIVDATVSFQLTMALWKWTPYIAPQQTGQPLKYFYISTEGSRVVKPTLTGNGAEVTPETGFRPRGEGANIMFGPYIESVTVEMWFDSPKAILKVFAPSTDIERGSESQSFGINFGFGGGFFGEEPTATASVGFSFDTSHTIDLTDFQLRASSDARTNKSHHVVALTMKGDGSRYEGADSLDATGAGPNTLPARAFNDLPVLVEGMWELPDSDDELDFHVRFTVVCPAVSAYGFSLAFSNDSQWQHAVKPTFVWDRVIPVPLAKAVKKTGEPGGPGGLVE